MNEFLNNIKKNPLKNGFFLMSLISFGLALLSQWLGRTLLMCIHSNPKIPSTIKPVLQSAGWPQDISIASYYTIIVVLLLLLPKRAYFIAGFQSLFLFLQSLVLLVDYYLLKTWSCKINRQALDYLSYPQEIINSIATEDKLYIILGILILCISLFFLGSLFYTLN